MSRVHSVITLVLAVCSLPALASGDNGTRLTATSGQLYVSGTMHEAACQVDLVSRSQLIDLPNLNTAMLSLPGDRAEGVAFSLKLKDCIRGASPVANNQNLTMAWNASQPLIKLTFDGPADTDSPELFQVAGAKGIGLRLQDEIGDTLRPGVASAPRFMVQGDNELHFILAAERTVEPLQADMLSATLDFQLDYQ
ncbi:fimbrial protein [Enterobacter mori]|uniref:fimbrial protein n=1 Tax=Enterobacter mori TaxID=539813 RepID=UPI002B210384|nr:fimbrial protein [Enterobacter mori]MEA5206347.1 fimbrial protein [Enterobacter mori]